jgi:AcrR family transcriptional regulator
MPAPDPARRDRILREAITILAERGERELTVRAVAAASGCSTTGVYTYFSGRPGLLDAIIISGFDRLDAATDAAAAKASPGIDSIIARCRAYADFAAENPTQYELMFSSPVPDFERSAVAGERGIESFELFCNAVDAAISSGAISDGGAGAPLVTGTLWATLHGHATIRNKWPVTGGLHQPWEHDSETAIAWLLRGLASSSPAPR